MMFMNEFDIDRAFSTYEDDPIMGPAVLTLISLKNWTNENSDGWCYWPKPCRAARKLMELIQEADLYARDMSKTKPTEVKLRAALAPIKQFRTKHRAMPADFTIFEG